MGYPLLSARVNLSGRVTDGEIFVTSFGLANCVPGNQTELQAIADFLATTFVDDLGPVVPGMMSQDQSLETLTVYTYGGGGSHSDGQAASDLVIAGTSNSIMPLQQCAVATLRTGRPGRRYRGRMYFPASGLPTTTGHFFSATTMDAFCSGLSTYFSDINAEDTLNVGQPSVISTTGSVATQILQVTVDQKPDIQRRRANSQPSGTVASHAVSV